jgi:hypothetical protein
MQRGMFSPGTTMREVPPDHRGISVREWLDGWWDEMRKACQGRQPNADFANQRISSSRDNYGWRSLASGTRYIGR